MIIQHNLSAINANRQYGIVESTRKKSAEKLSSGYRINRAADDAAGLSISEKMRRQIRGLTQASENTQDGISLVQSAEGALNEVHEMLQRVNELCVKAANGTLTYEDRGYIQQEISQITTEIDRVGATATFNEIKVLGGIPQKSARAVIPSATINGTSGTLIQATDDSDAHYIIDELQRGDVAYIPDGDGSSGTYYQVATAEDIYEYEQEWRDYYAAKSIYDADKRNYDIALAEYEEAMANYDPSAPGAVEPVEPTAPTSPVEPLRRDGSTSGKAKLTEIPEINIKLAANIMNDNLKANSDIADSVSLYSVTSGGKTDYTLHFYGPLTINLQVGSNSEDTFTFKIKTVNAPTLGIHDIYVKDNDGSGALDGVEKVKEAIVRNSAERSNLGAIQNRLEHTIRNLDNVVENTTAAESRIRDTDMASEMLLNSNSEILAQAGQAMMVQANQSNSGVLSLLL